MNFVQELILLFLSIGTYSLELPNSCKSDEYFESNLLECQRCPANASMVTSPDGFGCKCVDHSIPFGINRCRPCNTTDVVSSDGLTCVPRKCQNTPGRIICRKCPNDYISVTQNFDGSPMKEVLCVKCARGYRAVDNVCVRCEACACAKNEVIISGSCLPKKFVNERPKHEETRLHPNALLEIVKLEYLCTKNVNRACRRLADECVRDLYSIDLAGPCRLWIQPKITTVKGLPMLAMESASEKSLNEISLTRGMSFIKIAQAVYTRDGGFKMIQDAEQLTKCMFPIKIYIGKDYSLDCHLNISQMDISYGDIYAPFLVSNDDYKPLPVRIRKPSGYYVQKESWSSAKFARYFHIAHSLSTTVNITNTIYLRTLLTKLQIQRDKKKSDLLIYITIEAQYASLSPLASEITTTLKVEHELPNAGIMRGLEIWGGVLGAFLALYGAAQARGCVRRGGLAVAAVPLLAGAVADALYFAVLLSTLHALAAEAGTLGLTLPLSRADVRAIRVFLYTAIGLKMIKVVWVNWKQCRNDIFFIDWTEYNPPVKYPDSSTNGKTIWRAATLSREWSSVQTMRRACPGHTATLALILYQLTSSWKHLLPESAGYNWAVATIYWWSAYITVASLRWGLDKLGGPPTNTLQKVCASVDMSLMVFQEEYYAHYVHGRNDNSETRILSGEMAACRIICAPQLRLVYRQLATSGLVSMGDAESKYTLLSRFLGAFFERALDGLGWVANERTVLERLLDVELVVRETGATSVLLYDPVGTTPSCFSVTWWCEEWTLGTFEALFFGCIVLATGEVLLATLLTIVMWQVLKNIRTWFGNRNQRIKTGNNIL